MISVGIKEILIILGIIAFMVWLRMFRVSMEENTTRFFKKLAGPEGMDGGFGWRALLVAFFVGVAICSGIAFIALKIWTHYHPV